MWNLKRNHTSELIKQKETHRFRESVIQRNLWGQLFAREKNEKGW